MSGKNLDLTSDPGGCRKGGPHPRTHRRFLGVQFACCDVYGRVYVNREETAYVGGCPRCGRRIRFAIGPGGTAARFFRAE